MPSAAPEKAATGSALEALRAELQRVRTQKVQAIEVEDFDLAGELKERQVELEARIREAEVEAQAVESARQQEAVREELERISAEKARAVENEDFALASELKAKQQALEAQLQQLQDSSGAG